MTSVIPPSLYDLLPAEMDALIAELGMPAYRSNQVLQALYREFPESVEEIRQLPAEGRAAISSRYRLSPAAEVRRVASADGNTTKLLLRMADGTPIETVLMQYPDPGEKHPRSTVCVSTQAGCAMGCVFCATGQMGFERNLSAGEVVSQVIHVARLLKQRGEHVTNVVFMGMGEPLANYAETVRAVRILTDGRAFGLGQRHITISTVGVIRAIDRLAAEGLQVGLAISLHSPIEELRQRLVPTAGPHSVQEIVSAAKRYFKATGRRVTFEYALIAGQNDSPEVARQLAGLLRGTPTHVNLIPVNPTAGGFGRPVRAAVLEFERILVGAGINCTTRVEKGSEISAACGQLRTDQANTIIPAEELSLAPVAPMHGRRQAKPSPSPSQTR
ncbi:MAG: 23S rRNA (adenine(2503)-C(2))-methyltransferase RlmN [Dehalococcoidia bacterium]|nr:23S rRNA (adenine(2503)-C(2))-methyltransferase RlmN [Dehalococcoidia bacterium]